jgi:hypothetical protein
MVGKMCCQPRGKCDSLGDHQARDREHSPLSGFNSSDCVSLYSQVFALRSMLAVPFYEKALYELSDEELTPSRLIDLAIETELSIQGARASRPLLSVPHLLADESAAYYHGYVLAEMSVHHTRDYFHRTYGHIVDNENVGKDLTEVYWKPGNSKIFLELVEKLTGSPLSSQAWVNMLQKSVEDVLQEEKDGYERGIREGPKFPRGSSVDRELDMRVMLVHGDEVIADSAEKGLREACEVYKSWINTDLILD